MKRIIFALLLAVTSIYCSGQDYIDWVSSSQESIKYGYLYNWQAATDTRVISSSGWSLPTLANFNTLRTYLGGNSVAGGKMKETGFTYWDSPNTGADNTSGFNGRGHGSRTYDTGAFISLRLAGVYWSSDETDAIRAASINLINTSAAASTNTIERKLTGHGIRLIKNSTSLTNGQTGTYTGNDGKVYRTICIGTQEWLADNLAETQYRNGDAIPEVTSNIAWAALTTGARCVYNNDESNR